MMHSAVIFDLDGTLLDTIDDLADAMNAVLERNGFPLHPVAAYKQFVGDGVEPLVRRALPEDAEGHVAVCMEEMRVEYGRRCFDKTRPYDGITNLLADLKARQIPMAVLSNKPDEATQRVVDRYFEAGTFAIVRGAREGTPLKPDPRGALEIARDWGLCPAEIVYIGDTNTDMRTAVAAGMTPVGALWGFRSEQELRAHGAAHLCAAPQDVPTLL
jgi:phosphoglycolate phosphatase